MGRAAPHLPRSRTGDPRLSRQVLDQAMEIEAIVERYEALAAELLAWIHHTVTIIGNQKFANSLTGVQQQLQAFTAFCTLEKPVKSAPPGLGGGGTGRDTGRTDTRTGTTAGLGTTVAVS